MGLELIYVGSKQSPAETRDVAAGHRHRRRHCLADHVVGPLGAGSSRIAVRSALYPHRVRSAETAGSKKKNQKKCSLGQAMILIAQLGGYLNRKCDGVPGFESLWRGYARFCDMVKIVTLDQAVKSKCQIKRRVTHAL